MIVFIGCGKSKLNCKAKAKDMYIGNYFKKTLQFARTFNADKIFILSAKYGLLELNDVISPYDLTLNKMSKQDKKSWSAKVYQQLKNKNIDFDQKTIFLTCKNYNQFLKQKFKNHIIPFKNIGGMGLQIQFIKKEIQRSFKFNEKQ